MCISMFLLCYACSWVAVCITVLWVCLCTVRLNCHSSTRGKAMCTSQEQEQVNPNSQTVKISTHRYSPTSADYYSHKHQKVQPQSKILRGAVISITVSCWRTPVASEEEIRIQSCHGKRAEACDSLPASAVRGCWRERLQAFEIIG